MQQERNFFIRKLIKIENIYYNIKNMKKYKKVCKYVNNIR